MRKLIQTLSFIGALTLEIGSAYSQESFDCNHKELFKKHESLSKFLKTYSPREDTIESSIYKKPEKGPYHKALEEFIRINNHLINCEKSKRVFNIR